MERLKMIYSSFSKISNTTLALPHPFKEYNIFKKLRLL
jgi:hypothetical protein